MHFAKVIVEWDAIRQGKGVDEPINVDLIESVNSRIVFQSVMVSQVAFIRLVVGGELHASV